MTPGDQELSVGVAHAWQYLRYQNIPPTSGSWIRPRVAIVDGGSALDASGVPSDGNLDYFYYGARPLQADLVDRDGTAGGANLMRCGGSACPWHGQGAFSVAAALPRNSFGAAGVGGPVARPMLLRVDASYYTVADAIYSAVINGADIISLSLGGDWCSSATWLCTLPPDDAQAMLNSAVRLARSSNAIFVAAAGNTPGGGLDISAVSYLPCKLEGVICVGAVVAGKGAASYSNYGAGVDIWAPTDIYATPNPMTAGQTGLAALPVFNGTSAATPFVAGLLALMRTLDPELSAAHLEGALRFLPATQWDEFLLAALGLEALGPAPAQVKPVPPLPLTYRDRVMLPVVLR